jgi:D-arabinose 1-dehydrogenase-like Zn-dependent alcohol dehydrogenase
MNIPVGETVAIQGLGGLGHLAIQYANKMGYRVVAISRDAKKERLVRELGAHEYIDSSQEDAGTALQKLGGASLVVSTAPTAEVMSPLLKGLGILGKLLILSGQFIEFALGWWSVLMGVSQCRVRSPLIRSPW